MPENSSIPPILNPAAEKLRRGEVVISMSAKLVVDHGIGVLAGSAGFDIVFIDMEHGAFSMDDIGRISVAAHLSGVTPLVRVPSLDVASRVLDMGALGVIAPHISTT
jgi:2-keto-3-deoxy-L-rhamnonate aldolase RhmA